MRSLIAQHFEGRIDPVDERVLREHLPACAACGDCYQRHLLLSQMDPRGLDAPTRLATGLGLRRAPRPFLPWSLALAASVAAAAALLLVLPVHLRDGGDRAGFVARGGPRGSAELELLVYRIAPGQPPRLVKDEIDAIDELAFAYRSSSKRKWLLVFGVDEKRQVHWYHPGWMNGAAPPLAVPLRRGSGVTELPEAVRHPLRGARLAIHALCADARLSVTRVEELVRQTADPAAPLRLAGAADQVLELRVRHRRTR